MRERERERGAERESVKRSQTDTVNNVTWIPYGAPDVAVFDTETDDSAITQLSSSVPKLWLPATG